jgi:hypothetical protein
MATRMQQRRGTAAQWTAANSVLAAGEIGFETDTGKFKIGDGTNTWASLSYFQDITDLSGSYIPLSQKGANSGVATLDSAGKIPVAQLGNVIDGAPEVLDTLNELAAAINDDAAFLTTLAPKAGPTFTGNVVLPSSTTIGDVSATELGYLNNVTSAIQTQIDNKSPINNPTFTGNVVLPSTTTIGDLSSAEIGYLATVSSNVQTQLDAKLASGTASTTYATLAGPTFTGTVVLPSTTSVGDVSSTELGYVNGVTSAIQTQLDAKAPTADPTFTGTVSGVTKTHVGLGNVDNTADSAKPVSTAQATAIATAKSEAIQAATDQVNAVISSAPAALNTLDELAAALGDDANFATTVTNSIATKAPIAGPTFTGLTTVSASGIAFTDGTQTKQGVPSITTISQKTDSYTLANLNERDTLVEISKSTATTLTIPTNATIAYPVGTSIDILQTGTGQVTIAGAGGVTVNATPGLKLRTQWSSATLFKRATDTWVVFGDLTA